MKKLLVFTTMIATMIMSVNVFAGIIEDTIENGVKSGQTTIDVSSCGASVEEVVNAFSAMFNTNPVMSNLDGSFQCAYKGDKATTITVGYIETGVSVSESQKSTDAIIATIVKEAKAKTSKIEQAKYVHDYLINKSVYDYSYNSTTIYDLLVNGKGTCNSYSMAFKAIMDKLGIECVIIEQNDKAHAWNQIKIDGKWYNVDVTWDENYSQGTTADATFFMKSDEYFKVTEHGAWNSVNKCNDNL